jgi:extracellular elastinolytic metalloproteinase
VIEELSGRRERIKRHFSDEQTVLSGLSDLVDSFIRPIEHIVDTTCSHTDLPFDMMSKPHDIEDSRHALLQFMIAATPRDHMVQDILSKYDEYINGMSSTFESRVIGDSVETTIEKISGVPDTVAPVKARLAYIQAPVGETTALHLVWKFEVQMQDNWYEAAVAADLPHKIISVVDWASDAHAPIPKERKPATYNVFSWGLNDPSEGGRSIQTESFDKLASPAGWHALPIANDPQSSGRRYISPSAWRNTTTTYGNNVRPFRRNPRQNSDI